MDTNRLPAAAGQSALTSATAIALYVALADVAIETWLSGSPVRYWTAGALAAYAALTALAWRRVSWADKAAASVFVFLAAAAGTAWLPGGLTTGVRAAGQPTATVLSALVMAAVALAAAIVWRFDALPRAARTFVLLIAAYAVTAFVYGLANHVPFTDLWNGGSIWQRLPSWIQGAFVGGVVVVPVALLIAIVRAGIPRFREGSPRYALYQAVALATSFAMVLSALPASSSWRHGAPASSDIAGIVPQASPIVPSPELSASLENSLRAIEDGERESPRDRWDPAYVVEHVGKDPQVLFAWVAGNTSWVPYRGLLRGPVGVLMDRMGDSLDRAVLLAALLKEAGHQVRLAHGELARDRAAALLPLLAVARAAGVSRPAPPMDAVGVRQVADQYHLDRPAIERTLASAAAEDDRLFSSLDSRVAAQTARLRAAIGDRAVNGSTPSSADAAIDRLRDHWWVQRLDAGAWVDLDLLSPDGRPLTATNETLAPDEIAAPEKHQVIVRVVSERWASGTVAERVALQSVLSPADLIGKPIVLRFWPRRWPAQFPPSGTEGKGALRATALAQHEWIASLQVGRETVAKSSLLESGDINDHPMTNDFSRVGGSTAGSADDAASLLRGMASEGAAPTAPSSVLTAAWLEFEVRTPGQPPRTIRHRVFDLLGPSARLSSPVPPVALDELQRLTRSLSLTMETEILPVVCRISSGFATHLLAQSVLTDRETLRQLVRGDFTEATIRPEEAFGRLTPMPGPLYTLARARLDANRFRDNVYIDSVNVLTRHIFFAPSGTKIALHDATDIVTNGVGVDLGVADPVAVRIEQGVLDTNAEAQLLHAPSVVGSPANAFADSQDWVTIRSAGDPQLSTLRYSDDDRKTIAQDLAGGAVIVAPRAPVRVGTEDFVGWWRVDPATGTALGVDNRGWGPAMAEYGLLLEGAFVGFLYAYLQCKSGPGVPSTTPDIAGDFAPRPPAVPALDYLVAPLTAAPSPCLGIAYSAAAVGALLGLYAGSFRGGGGGGGGGRGGGSGSGAGGAASEGAAAAEGAAAGRGGGGSGGGSGSGTGGPGGSGGSGGGGGRGQGAGAAESAAEAQPPRGAPPAEAPTAPKGPYRGDPVGRDLIKNNPDSIASKAMGGPELFEGADQAATKAYNAGRQMGMNDEDASALSRQAWDKYVEQWTPTKILAPGVPGGQVPYGQIGREVVPGAQPANPVGATLPAGGTLPIQAAPCGAPPCGLPTTTVPLGTAPSPQAKSIGGLTNLGNVLKGGS